MTTTATPGETRGMRVDVYRPADGFDGTLRGVTSRATVVVLLDARLPPITVGADEVCLRLVERVIGGVPYMHAEPVGEPRPWYMFGGNFVYTSDSRFRALCSYPIPVHDRSEG